jgi:DNA-directed RNA polymerase specialized sigma24 family protein
MSGSIADVGTRRRMKSDLHSAGAAAKSTADERHYATAAEVEGALLTLTETDYVKLRMIAKLFCRSRKFSTSVIEPDDLLSEAVLKTLAMEKKWNKEVSIVRHLDRAMENISGHLARARQKVVPLPDGLTRSHTDNATEPSLRPSTSNEIGTDDPQSLVSSVFGDDKSAALVLVRQAQGFQKRDIVQELGINDVQYDTIMRRIRRKIFKFSTQH